MNKISKAAQRLKALRERAGLSMRDISDAVGMSSSGYAHYENEFKKPYLPLDVVRKIEAPFLEKGVTRAEMLELAGITGAPSVRPTKTPDLPPAYSGSLNSGLVEVGSTEYASIGRFDASLSAGPGCILEEEPEPLGFHLVEAQWLRTVTKASPNHLAVVKVDGNSMSDTLLHDDWVLIDLTQRRFQREGIYAINVHGQAWIKRLSLNLAKQLVQVISDNTIYPIQELAEDDIQMIGRVVSLVLRQIR